MLLNVSLFLVATARLFSTHKQIYANPYSVQGSIIRNVTTINAYGPNSLTDSVIISETGYGTNQLTLILIGEQDTFYFYCNDTDLCEIDCVSRYSCINITIICHGKCSILCDYFTINQNSLA